MANKLRQAIFRQLFDAESWTYTYLLGCPRSKEAILIDPVDLQVERDLQFINDLGLKLKYAMNTHCHADHITGTGLLKTMTSCQSIISEAAGAKADILLNDGDHVKFGDHEIEALSTPGHTNGCMTFVDHVGRRAFTGDALLVRACGRTDFQQGDPRLLYDSVHGRIFTLEPDYLIYPAHDYKGRTVTSVEEEKHFNPRLTKSKEEFVKIMENLGLAYPKKIDEAVPWNLMCGPSQMGEVEKQRKSAAS